ncbi:hypothetical protein B0T16DRAFT_490741 [Cercophora newfieldiana]|uniref:Uncharacterized protein n=1 Tax=Cercophora newfieldiana TaxID=92897 RepID=A0AA39YJ94_9PEZI|nr:hypothetical protein B0T16DRAFT_490741 [Cercophora newfieldiana]
MPYLRHEFSCFHPSHTRHGVTADFSYLGRLDPKNAVTFYPTLTISRKAFGSKGKRDVLCPHVKFDDGVLLQAFWPSRCACFGLHHPLPWQACDRALKELPDRYNGDPKGVPLAECLAAAKADPSREGKFLTPGAVHTAVCRACITSYFWRLERTSVFLEVLAEAEGVTYPLDRKWLSLVDPETWGVRDSEGTKNILWCKDDKCRVTSTWEEHGWLNESLLERSNDRLRMM